MPRCKELEDYQNDAYKQDIATYTFTVKVDGTTSEERVKLKAKKPGVKLHFLRYGVFNSRCYHEMNYINITAPEDNRPIEYSVVTDDTTGQQTTNRPIELREVFVTADRIYPKPSDNACDLQKAQYRITDITKGYIYILAQVDDNKLWLEFAVNEFGYLNPIYWKDNIDKDNNYKDVRDVICKKSFPSVIINEGTKIWTMLSLSQLSIKQLDKYAQDPDSHQRFKSLVCNPIEKSSSIEERKNEPFRSFKEFQASFNSCDVANSELLKSQLMLIAKLEYPENSAQEDTTFEDLFILLEDPIQCANDFTKVIDSEIAWLKALTDTLRNAQSATELYANLMNPPTENSKIKDIEPEDIKDIGPEENEEIQYIFALALATYKFVYDNEELKDDFSRKHGKWYLNHGIDDQKLDKILGITHRKKQRDLINLLRDDFGNFLKSDYYSTALKEDFFEGSYRMIEKGKDIIADHILTLVTHPTMVDRHLLLQSEYKPTEDKWIQQVKYTIEGKSDFKEINRLLDLKVPIDAVEQEDSKAKKYGAKFCAKFLSHFGKMAKSYIAVGALNDTQIKLVDAKINYLTITDKTGKTGSFYRIDRQEFLEQVMNDNKSEKKIKIIDKGKNIHFTKKYAFLKIHEEILEEEKKIARRTGMGKEATITVQGKNRLKYSKQLEKMISSPQYQSAVLFFEVWALCNVSEKLNKKGLGLETGFDAVGALIKTTAASLKLTESFYKVSGAATPKFLTPKLISGFSVVGSGITVISASKDVINAVAASDNDAALAYSVAAGASGFLLYAEICSLGGTTLATGPFIVVAAIGLLAYGLAYYLTDSELEAFFKHYPFSTKARIDSTSDNPFIYARAMYAERAELINIDEAKYMGNNINTYKHLFVRLTNLISGGLVTIEGRSEKDREGESSIRMPGSYNDTSDFWTSMDVRISFASFLLHQQQIDYQVYLLQGGNFFNGEGMVSYRLPDKYIQPYMIRLENGTNQLQLRVQVPNQLTFNTRPANASVAVIPTINNAIALQKDAHIAVLCHFKGDSETIFPLTQSNTHGCFFAHMQVAQRDSEGVLVKRSGNPMIINKEAFLKAFPLKNPE